MENSEHIYTRNNGQTVIALRYTTVRGCPRALLRLIFFEDTLNLFCIHYLPPPTLILLTLNDLGLHLPHADLRPQLVKVLVLASLRTVIVQC